VALRAQAHLVWQIYKGVFQCHPWGGIEKEITPVPDLESRDGETSAWKPDYVKNLRTTIERTLGKSRKYTERVSLWLGENKIRQSWKSRIGFGCNHLVLLVGSIRLHYCGNGFMRIHAAQSGSFVDPMKGAESTRSSLSTR